MVAHAETMNVPRRDYMQEVNPRIPGDMEWFDMEQDAMIMESYQKILLDAGNASIIQLNSTESLMTVIIHPSTHKDDTGLWQISWLDEAGVPSMHETASSREAALMYMAGFAVEGGHLRGQMPHLWFVSGKR